MITLRDSTLRTVLSTHLRRFRFRFFRHCRLTAQLKPQCQFNSVVSTEYFVAVMMFDFESTSTGPDWKLQWSGVITRE